MATTKIRSSSIEDGQVANADLSATVAVTGGQIADDAVTLDKMAALARGKIIVGDSSGDPSALTVGAANQVLKSDGTDVSWGADSGGLFSSYAVIVDSKASTSGGGGFTSGAWRTRDLNLEIADPDDIVSISSNEFTLAAGSYLITWSCPHHQVTNCETRLYDVTGTAHVQSGSSGYSGTGANTQGRDMGAARVTPSGSNVYRIEHRCDVTNSTNGFGVSVAYGETIIFTIVEIYKET